MTDLHTHVLPGIDDGAVDLDTAVQMLKIMKADGVKTVVATPHFDYTSVSPEEFIAERSNSASQIKSEAENLGMRLLYGCELKLSPRILQLDGIKEFCIFGTNYILVEMPFVKSWDDSVYDNLINLIDYFNVQPIIAHVERYYPIIKNHRIAEKLIDIGAILQLDASSLFEKQFQKIAKKLLKNNLISVVASDAHNTDSRSPELLAKAFDEIEKLFGKEMVLELKMNADELVK